MIVLDASAAVELLLRRESFDRVAAFVLADEESLHAPHLIDAEVAQTLRGMERRGEVSSERSSEALEDLRHLSLIRHPHTPFLDRVWELRSNLTAYDGLYVALAEALGSILITVDHRLARSGGHGAQVVVP